MYQLEIQQSKRLWVHFRIQAREEMEISEEQAHILQLTNTIGHRWWCNNLKVILWQIWEWIVWEINMIQDHLLGQGKVWVNTTIIWVCRVWIIKYFKEWEAMYLWIKTIWVNQWEVLMDRILTWEILMRLRKDQFTELKE